jgi:methionyl-tRNA synthetase
MAPWGLAKQGDRAGLTRVLTHAAECLRIVSGLLYPVMPAKMTELRRALGLPDADVAPHFADLAKWGGHGQGSRLQPLASLFPRITADAAGRDRGDAGAAATAPDGGSEEGLIELAEFGRIALRTATVVAAEPVAGADKLLRLEIELGAERRQIVAGIARHYAPAALVGRTIVVVANLKPATIRGIASNGMLLAAKSGDVLRLVTVDADIASGAGVS